MGPARLGPIGRMGRVSVVFGLAPPIGLALPGVVPLGCCGSRQSKAIRDRGPGVLPHDGLRDKSRDKVPCRHLSREGNKELIQPIASAMATSERLQGLLDSTVRPELPPDGRDGVFLVRGHERHNIRFSAGGVRTRVGPGTECQTFSVAF